MKILCLGNNTIDTANKVADLAAKLGQDNHGLITQKDFEPTAGVYYTSIADIHYVDIIELGEKFDKIIILDQPLTDWDSPKSYYLTVGIGLDIERKTQVEWQNKNYE